MPMTLRPTVLAFAQAIEQKYQEFENEAKLERREWREATPTDLLNDLDDSVDELAAVLTDYSYASANGDDIREATSAVALRALLLSIVCD